MLSPTCKSVPTVIFVFLLLFGLVFVVISIIFLAIGIIEGILGNEQYGSGFLGAFYGCFFIFMFSVIFYEKNDVLKRYLLNEKIFLLFSFLDDELDKKTNFFTKMKINYIITRIVGNLYTLEGNLNNRFIFLHDKSETVLIKKIKDFILNNVRSLVKQKKIEEIKKVIQIINEMYGLSILRELVSKSLDEKQTEVYLLKFVELEAVLIELSSLKDSSEKRGFTIKRLINVIQTKWFKFVLVLILTAGLFVVMIVYKDIIYIPAIITVLAFSFGILTWMLQSNNDSSNKRKD